MIGLSALCPGERRSDRRERAAALAEAVFGNADVMFCVLNGNVGTSTYVACAAVNKACLHLCRFSEELLRSVALYCAGLTKTVFCGLFAVTWTDAAKLPHSVCARRTGGVYCVYGADAVQAVLCRPGGMHVLRERQRLRLVAVGMTSCVQVACEQRRSLRSWELEERLHRLSYESPVVA